MPTTLPVPENLVEPLRAFVRSQRIPLRVAADGHGSVRVAQAKYRRRSTPAVIYTGGWIACTVARGLADTLGIKTRQVGALLDHLDIKVRACELGCFK